MISQAMTRRIPIAFTLIHAGAVAQIIPNDIKPASTHKAALNLDTRTTVHIAVAFVLVYTLSLTYQIVLKFSLVIEHQQRRRFDGVRNPFDQYSSEAM